MIDNRLVFLDLCFLLGILLCLFLFPFLHIALYLSEEAENYGVRDGEEERDVDGELVVLREE